MSNSKTSQLGFNKITSTSESNRMEAISMVQDMCYPVFPLGNNKRPLIQGGFKSATDDIDTIDEWWSGMYSGAMVGVPTGDTTGIVVVDVDNKNGKYGSQSLKELEEKHGEVLPKDYLVKTPSGGYHIYLQLKEGQSLSCSVSKVPAPNFSIGNLTFF